MSFSRTLISDLEKSELPIDNRILKQRLDQFSKNGETSKKVISFTDYYDWFIDYYTIKPRPRTQKPLAKSTLKPHNNSLRILKDFEKSIKIKLTFEHITLNFHSDFIDYLQSDNFTENYIGSQIKNIKTVMNVAFERGHHTCMDYQKSGFTKPREDVNYIYLIMEEIKDIKKIDYLKKPHLDVARDLFVIAAVTGLIVSDYKSLTTSNIKQHNSINYLEVKTQKTGEIVHIPLHPFVTDILNKRDGEFPKMIAEQKINDALKIIGKKAKLNEEIIIERTRGGIRKEEPYKKHKLLTNHTARRSFCTNAYKADMPVIDIMAISGHTSEKIFYNYIKASPMERLEKISKHTFFN
ncbi:site-specific integrase [Gillisia sp. JM1]|uniref:site-specific integrase n=1 Tax=Gillisia sp. JM1 TaxID=1283286 RepID=UPI000418C578|nr:site-specific integrase [Gillisia sp. JM1]